MGHCKNFFFYYSFFLIDGLTRVPVWVVLTIHIKKLRLWLLHDHSGWHPTRFVDRNKKSHSIYAQSLGGPVDAKGNIFARAAANCAQFRAGADAEDNLCVENPIGFWVGRNDSKVNRNVHIDSRDIFQDWEIPGLVEEIAEADAKEAACIAAGGSKSDCAEKPDKNQGLRGKGFTSQGGIQNLEVFGNIVAHKGGAQTGGTLAGKPAYDFFASNLTHGGNIAHDWIPASQSGNHEIIINGNNVAGQNGNIATKEEEANLYVDASRDLISYAKHLRIGDTREDFYEAVASREAGEWIPSLTSYAVYDYLKEGFTLKTAQADSQGAVAGAQIANTHISVSELVDELEALDVSTQTIKEVLEAVLSQ